MVEIPHNTAREYPDKGFDIVSCFVHDPFRSALNLLQQDTPGHELSRSLVNIFGVKKGFRFKLTHSHTGAPFYGNGRFERGVSASRWLGSIKHAAPVIIIVLWADVTFDDHSGL